MPENSGWGDAGALNLGTLTKTYAGVKEKSLHKGIPYLMLQLFTLPDPETGSSLTPDIERTTRYIQDYTRHPDCQYWRMVIHKELDFNRPEVLIICHALSPFS